MKELKQLDIDKIIYEALKEKIGQAINYHELHAMIEGVVESRKDEFEKLLNKCLDKVFADKTFQDVIVEEFRHKTAKNLVGKLEGAIEHNVNKFRQDPAMNAKMILALKKIIDDNS